MHKIISLKLFKGPKFAFMYCIRLKDDAVENISITVSSAKWNRSESSALPKSKIGNVKLCQ